MISCYPHAYVRTGPSSLACHYCGATLAYSLAEVNDDGPPPMSTEEWDGLLRAADAPSRASPITLVRRRNRPVVRR